MRRWLVSLLLAAALLIPAPAFPKYNPKVISPRYLSLILEQAKEYVGVRYRYGHSLARSRRTDCSGFVQFIYRRFGVELPRTARTQAMCGYRVDLEEMAPGDLVFFKYRGRIRHVGIYLGSFKMIHSSRSAGGVVITDLRDYRLRVSLVKRILVVKPSG